jgi:pyruvate formate lyase activating enzyme
MLKGMVFDIQRFSLHDGPGVRTILFLKGCSLRCKWCSNPESQLSSPELLYTKSLCKLCGNCVNACPENALSLTTTGLEINRSLCSACGLCAAACNTGALEISGKEYSVDETVSSLLKDRFYYEVSGGGVTISGGEPLLQDEFVKSILIKLKSLNIHTAVETAGLVEWKAIKNILDYTDLFLYDIKHLQNEKHISGTGDENNLILENLKKLLDSGAEVIIRYPLIPGFNMDREYVFQLIDFLLLLKVNTIHLLPYHNLGISKYWRLNRVYELSNLSPPSSEEIKEIEMILRDNTYFNILVNG